MAGCKLLLKVAGKALAMTPWQKSSQMRLHLALPVSRSKWVLVRRGDQEAERAEQCGTHCCHVQAAAACVAGCHGIAERNHTVQCFLPHAWRLVR